MTRRHDQMAPRDRDYNDTALLERSGASRRGRLSALHNDPEKLHWLFECNRTPSAATCRRFARVSRPTCWPRMMAAAAQRRLDRVFGVVIMAPWQKQSCPSSSTVARQLARARCGPRLINRGYQVSFAKKPNRGCCATTTIGGANRVFAILRLCCGFGSGFLGSDGLSCANACSPRA